MKIDRDTVEEIFATLMRNKSRSLLTAFGVFWGIFMLVSLVGGGNGLKGLLQENFDGFATNSCFVYSGRTGEAYKGFRKGRWWRLTTDDVELLRNNIPSIDVISPTVADWGKTAIHGDRKYSTSVKGLLPNYEAIEAQEIVYGRKLNEIDVRERRKVCVLGRRVYEALFDSGVDPCGEFVRVDGIYYRVVGVISTVGNINIQGNSAEQIIMPLSVYQTAYNYGKFIDIVAMKFKDGCKPSDIKPQMESLLKAAHTISPDDKQAVRLFDAEEIFSMVDNLVIGVRILVFLVGLGTLLAGIIGVSNIMMVTVRERTTEIGIRRAIGARPFDIMQQILSESVVLTLVAGMFGICAGVGFLQILDNVTADGLHDYGFQVSFGTAIGMLVVIVVLGIVAGFAPAYRAMAIKPVDAMRDE